MPKPGSRPPDLHHDADETLEVIPVVVETATIGKRTVEATHAIIRKTVSERQDVIDALLSRQDVEVERVPVGRIVAEAPAPYWDGDTWVLPILEEQIVVEKRLFLKEEIRVRTTTRHEQVQQAVSLREEHVTVEMLDPPRRVAGSDPARAGQHNEETLMSGQYSNRDSVSTDAGAYDPARHENQIVAMYADISGANAARDALLGAGIPASAIEVLNQTAAAGERRSGEHLPDEGFWGSMKSLFVPDEDMHAYSHAIERGHAMVIVTPSASMNRDRIIEVLESTNPIDFDAQLEEWRKTGYEYPGSSAPSGTTAQAGMAARATAPATPAAQSTRTETTRAAPGAEVAQAGETLKVMEEQLRVGKREVSRGSIRVRSYVVERPVEEQVRLRDERVTVERRKVDRAVSGDEAGLFQERTLEARATMEEPVVTKEARVVEEIGLRKEAQERTETIRDTVRKTEVEIQDESKPGSRDASPVDPAMRTQKPRS